MSLHERRGWYFRFLYGGKVMSLHERRGWYFRFLYGGKVMSLQEKEAVISDFPWQENQMVLNSCISRKINILRFFEW